MTADITLVWKRGRRDLLAECMSPARPDACRTASQSGVTLSTVRIDTNLASV